MFLDGYYLNVFYFHTALHLHTPDIIGWFFYDFWWSLPPTCEKKIPNNYFRPRVWKFSIGFSCVVLLWADRSVRAPFDVFLAPLMNSYPLCAMWRVLASNDKFEAWGYTIITLQDSQGELSEFTSKFWNIPLDTLNCNNNFMYLL